MYASVFSRLFFCICLLILCIYECMLKHVHLIQSRIKSDKIVKMILT